ncbi:MULTISPECIES: NAD-dependent epimerase/dehydratase family protein [Sphingobium]|uniref:NAD-dependent epimerase/dehydratase family protein n=1 Tax=Sphingobium TaxID=165695 RepID=UPI00159C5A27|nr:NAD-dependent epimerase/dehydratase family protein [Sphingobium sp. 15-1]
MKTAFVTGATGLLGRHLVRNLVEQGWSVRALHRSPGDAAALREIGAQPVAGDLNDLASLRDGMAGAAVVVFHAAALFTMWAALADFERVNIEGTSNMLAAAQAEGVECFVYISAAGVVMGEGKPMRDVTEDAPLAYPSWAPYLSTKARAQELVLEANKISGIRTAVIMPPMIWGRGMHMLDNIVKNVAEGRFRWPAGGEQMMSTAHVDNVCACAILAAEKSPGGRAYFVSDGKNQSMRAVLSDLLSTRGVVVKAANAPLDMAWRMAMVMEFIWRTFRRSGEPPLTRQMLRLVGYDFTVSNQRARDELGYQPVTNWAEGLAEMRASG